MKIMIIGCGKVGFTLARQLSGENHELVLLDHRAEAMQVADSSLDLMCVEGSGASIQTLREAGVKDTELVVAVTGSDELNIVCCLIAKKLGPGNLPAAAGALRLQRGELRPGAGGDDRLPHSGKRRHRRNQSL